jgi:hypothetical protein
MQIAPETTAAEVETKPARKPRVKKVQPVEPETTTTPDTGHVEESPETVLPATQTPEKVESTVLFAEDAPRAIVGDSVTLDPREPEPHSEQAAEDAAWRSSVIEANESLKRKVRYWEESKAETSALKKECDVASAYLSEVIDRKPEPLPLFDRKPTPATVATDDRWRGWKLEDVEDLPGGSLAAFEAKGLVTLGDLVDWQAKGNRLEDLPGIGEVKAEKIAECLVATHAVRPWDQPIVAEAVADESDDDDEDESFDDDDFEDDKDEPDDE